MRGDLGETRNARAISRDVDGNTSDDARFFSQAEAKGWDKWDSQKRKAFTYRRFRNRVTAFFPLLDYEKTECLHE